MKQGGFPDFTGHFRRAKITNTPGTAPRDGTPILACNSAGEAHLIRWRIGADLDEGDGPYWAVYETDEAFEFIEWIRSPLSLDEILEIYG